MIIKINQQVMTTPSLEDKFKEVVSETTRIIDGKSRDIRRHKIMKTVLVSLGALSTLGFASIAHADTTEDIKNMIDVNPTENIFTKIIGWGMSAGMKYETQKFFSFGTMRKDTPVWHLNNWIETALLHTTDFFGNAEILSVFHAIWTVCMGFVSIIIAKKGFDMVKAKVLGTTSLGAVELMVRLIASIIMTFVSLDVIEWGIEGSNIAIKTFFKTLESHLIPFEALQKTNEVGQLFWFIGFCIMTVVLAVQYWIRQITIVMLGVMTPIANLSWVVDGGKMLGTLIREMVTLLATPIVHALILAIGSVCMMEVTTMTSNGFLNSFNSIMIGFSTMFLMVFTPSFLRKFTTGSANPIKWAWNMGKGATGNVTKLFKLMK